MQLPVELRSIFFGIPDIRKKVESSFQVLARAASSQYTEKEAFGILFSFPCREKILYTYIYIFKQTCFRILVRQYIIRKTMLPFYII